MKNFTFGMIAFAAGLVFLGLARRRRGPKGRVTLLAAES